MRLIVVAFIAILLLNSCKKNTKEATVKDDTKADIEYVSFGKEIIPDDAIKAKSMAAHYETMIEGDSINGKIIAKVNDVCQAKGCWMKLDLGNEKEVMVKFKDYGFFVPKDIAGQEVIVNGKAYVKEVSVEELQHYASDAGKSAEEINKINQPKRTYSFEADGVLLLQ